VIMMRLPTLLIGASLLSLVQSYQEFRVGNIVAVTNAYGRGVIGNTKQGLKLKYTINFPGGGKRTGTWSGKIKFAYRRGDVCWCRTQKIKNRIVNNNSLKMFHPVIVIKANGDRVDVQRLDTKDRIEPVHGQQLYYIPGEQNPDFTVNGVSDGKAYDTGKPTWETLWTAKANKIRGVPCETKKNDSGNADVNGRGIPDTGTEPVKEKTQWDWEYLLGGMFALLFLAKVLGGTGGGGDQAAFVKKQASGGGNLCLVACMLLVPSALVGGGYFANKAGVISVPFLSKATAVKGLLSTVKDAIDSAHDSNEDLEDPRVKSPKRRNEHQQQEMMATRSVGEPQLDGIPTWLWIFSAVLILLVICCLGAMFFIFGDEEESGSIERDIEEGFQ